MDWSKVFKIVNIKPAHKDHRGQVIKIQVDPDHAIREIVFFERLSGVVCGQHGHRGTDPSKRPEKFVLVCGKVEFTFTTETGEEIAVILNPWDMIIIQPMEDVAVVHTVTVLKGPAVWAEARSTLFDPENPDAFSMEELIRALAG